VDYDNSLVVTIKVTCDLWAPSTGDHFFICGAIFRLPPNLQRWPVSSEISDFTPCAHAQSSILPFKFAERTGD